MILMLRFEQMTATDVAGEENERERMETDAE